MRAANILAIATLVAASIGFSAANAQQAYGVMAPGDAAVTGFSGVPSQQTSERIDRDGPSLRVISLPGGPFGLVDASKHFTATPREIGQVFGVALDDQPAPDIFVAATAAYGLGLYQPGHGRLRNGAPGAQYTPGQFGPAEQGGGPGSIWRIDGQSGDVTLFANVAFNGIQNTPASLGALAFDARTQQLFVADRATGLIHRFTLDGTDRGVFDHGLQGRQAAHIYPVPFDPATLANIQSGSFDTQNPRSWGFAPPMRRVFALAIHYGRLFYAVAANEQIWSVSIGSNGAFGGDARFETSVPLRHPGAEISQIAFDGRGQMYVAERGAPTGSADFVAVADSGQNRVLRFQPKQPGDPSPGYWHAPADEYAIGLLPDFQNANGGVGLTCGRTMWSTGERLLEPGNAPPGSFSTIDGLQGNDSNLVRPANVPPQQAWYVNYYDNQADPGSRGHMGSIAIRNVCGGAPPPPPPPPPIGFGCPPGTFAIGGACLVAPLCPEATVWRDGYCIYPHCPDGFANIRGECRRPPVPCRRGEVFFNDRCIPIGCPPRLERAANGYCGCPRDLVYRDGQCVPFCPRDEHRNSDGRCVPNCPRDFVYRDGQCVPPSCPPDMHRNSDGRCVPNCPRDLVYRDGRCVPPSCPPDMHRNSDGRCVPNCPRDFVYRDGQCVPPSCPPDEHRNSDGRCVPNCQPGITALANCPNPCPPGEKRDQNGRCYTPTPHCPPDEHRNSDGRCVSNCPPNAAGAPNCQPPCPGNEHRNSDGRCVPPPCPGNEVRNSDGRCVPNCPPGITALANCPNPCPAGEKRDQNGRCYTPTSPCPGDEHRNSDGRCVPNCPPGIAAENCGPVLKRLLPSCPTGEIRRDGICQPIFHRTPKCGPGERFVDGRCVSDNGSNSNTLVPIIKRRTTFTPICAKGEILRDGQCVPSGGSGETGGLGCSRQVYDRLGHCPTPAGNTGYGQDKYSGHRLLRPIKPGELPQ